MDTINRLQELLLQAALLQGKDAISAWETWKLSVDIGQIDPGSIRLLPLLHRNLDMHGIKDPLMQKFEEIHRLTWIKNYLTFRKMSALINSFHDAGIQTMILKGAALTLLYYRHYGLRPLGDFDLLVRTEQASEAIQMLHKLGWISDLKSPENLIPYFHACAFKNIDGQHLDLHWHILHECCQINADDEFWAGAVSTQINQVPTSALNPTDQLLHICVHGSRWSSIPIFRWAADAMIILNTSRSEIDWNQLITQAKKRRLILQIKKLNYLRDRLEAPVPFSVLKRIESIPVSKIEHIEYKYKTQNYELKPLGHLPILWFDYLRLVEGADSSDKIIGFGKYLQSFWELKHLWQLPAYLIIEGIRRIWKIMPWYKIRLARN